MIALTTQEDGRILGASEVVPFGIYDGQIIVKNAPEGSLSDYRYVDGEFVYDPDTQPSDGDVWGGMKTLEAKLEAVLRYQGLTVRQTAPGVYEVIKDVPESGDYLDPIPWQPGDTVTAGLWYYWEDKELPHEAIQSGVPGSFRDTEYFDFVEGT